MHYLDDACMLMHVHTSKYVFDNTCGNMCMCACILICLYVCIFVTM